MIDCRVAVASDLPALLASTDLFDDQPVLSGLSAFIDAPNDFLVLGLVNGEIAGFISIHGLPRPDAAREGFIFEVGTRETFKRMGVARAMIRFAREECSRRGIEGLWVITNRSNTAAVGLYEACGGTSKADDEVVYEWP